MFAWPEASQWIFFFLIVTIILVETGRTTMVRRNADTTEIVRGIGVGLSVTAEAGRTVSATQTTNVLGLARTHHEIATGTGGIATPADATGIHDLARIGDSITAKARGTVSTTDTTNVANLAREGNVVTAEARGTIA